MSLETAAETNLYLTFKLSDEVFALDILSVREVLDYTKVTKVPQTPEFMCGVINLRGSVVPVVDMRVKFGLAKTPRSANTCIIIAEVIVDGESMIIGCLADSVQEVIDIAADQIAPAPKIGMNLTSDVIKGIGKHNGAFVIILQIDRIFTREELFQAKSEHEENAVTA
jgi:purine-binding chemotaxis protein CheW